MNLGIESSSLRSPSWGPWLAALALSCVGTLGCPTDDTDDTDDYPDCQAPTDATVSLALAVDGVTYDPVMPPNDLLYEAQGLCSVTSAADGKLALDCPDLDGPGLDGQPHAFELTIEATPAVALPAVGTMVHWSHEVESDELSDSLAGWAVTLREGSADGALLLVVNGGHSVVLYALDSSYGPEDVCPHQEVDNAACLAYRRTSVSVDADGTTLEAFDHTSVDAGGLRMVVGDAAFRTASPDGTECGHGLGPGFGRFDLVIGPPG